MTQLLTMPEACMRLRLSRNTVRRLVDTGRLAAVRPGHRLLFAEADIDRFVENCNVARDPVTGKWVQVTSKIESARQLAAEVLAQRAYASHLPGGGTKQGE